MNLTDGQKTAYEQLKQIADYSDNLVEIMNYEMFGTLLVIDVSIECKQYVSSNGGFKFNNRERFRILVTPDFPFEKPWIRFHHTRFGGHSHVQWGSWICLYFSEQNDWIPKNGMAGLLTRLENWLDRASKNDLDPIDLPLHPPVTYSIDKSLPIVIPNRDIPITLNRNISSYFYFENIDEVIYINEWNNKFKKIRDLRPGLSIILKTSMPFEFPESLPDLFQTLINRGIDIIKVISDILTLADKLNKKENLY